MKEVVANQRRADWLIDRRLRRGDVDVLLLPEMAFSGYCFQDRDEILPYCEDPVTGSTAAWCVVVARRLDCVVVAGFPERGAAGQLFNSQLVVDRQGRVIHVSRKRFLYMTDETWAAEGPEFSTCEIPGVGRCALGICMDLNPKQFKAPFDRFEFASELFDPQLAHFEQPRAEVHRLKANVVLLSNNWLRAPADAAIGDEEHCTRLVNYWAHRFLPALDKPVVVVVANRVGIERGTRFAGCSCAIDLQTRTLLGRLNGTEEDVLVLRHRVILGCPKS